MHFKPLTIGNFERLARCRPKVVRPLIACSIRCTAGEHHSSFPIPDVLLLDATNILSRASIDAKRWSDVPEVSIRRCFEAWVDFLIAATPPHLLIVAVFDNPATGGNRKQQNSEDYLRRRQQRQQQNKKNSSPSNAGKLKPFIECIESREGGIAFVSEGGYEADECIGAVCTLITTTTESSLLKSSPISILIASGDSDMQQYLTKSTISWLHIASLPSLATPCAVSVVTEASFLSKHNFPLSAYSDFLALVGKKEANIGGVGIGSSLAAKLLKQFHSIKGIEQAARQGILKGWPTAVEEVILSKSKAAVQLERNRKVFSTITDPEVVLTSEQREKVKSQIKRARVESSNSRLTKRKTQSSTDESILAWQHPLYAIRWLQAGPIAKNLAAMLELRNVGLIRVQAATPQGLPIDIFISGDDGGESGGDSGRGGIGVMVCAPCDFNDRQNSITSQNEESETAETVLNSIVDLIQEETKIKSGEGGEEGPSVHVNSIHDPCRVGKKLNRAMQHHISLLKKSGVAIMLIPWWIGEQY